MKLMGQSDEDKKKGKNNRNREPLGFGESCSSVPVYNKRLEVKQLKIEIRNLKLRKNKQIQRIYVPATLCLPLNMMSYQETT